jgi:uncharacterized coiled-coil DUF342 family protein
MARLTITELQEKLAESNQLLALAREESRQIAQNWQTGLREAKDQYEKEVAELKKQIESEKNNYKWANERAAEVKAELDATHCLVDAIDCPLPRKSKNPDGYGETENSLVLRIGAWLAKKAGMGAN